MPTYRYTTREEMSHLFTAIGVEFRLEGSPDCQLRLNFYIDDATSYIDQYLSTMYNQVDLNSSTWVRTRATWIACYRLSQVGGNPSLFGGRFEEIVEELQKVKDGSLVVPELGTKWDLVPSMSNIDHDPRFRARTRRVDGETSSPSTGGTKSRDMSEDWWNGLW